MTKYGKIKFVTKKFCVEIGGNMKLRLGDVLKRRTEEILREYLKGSGFSEENIEAYLKFKRKTEQSTIWIEQVGEKAILLALEEIPELAEELNKITLIKQIFYKEEYLGINREFVLKNLEDGKVLIIRNKKF